MINQRDKCDKELLALGREREELWQRYWITLQLPEPVQRGWMRHYVISEKIGNHKHRAIFQDILEVIGTTAWSKTPDFRALRRRNKKCVLTEVDQPLKVISVSRWEERQYPEAWKRYFCLEPVRHKQLWHQTYVFAHRRVFEFKVEPLFVTEVKVPDPAVEKRMSEIEQRLCHRYLSPRLDWLLGIRRGSWKHDPRRRLISELHNREAREALKNFPEVDSVSVTNRYHISLLAIISPA